MWRAVREYDIAASGNLIFLSPHEQQKSLHGYWKELYSISQFLKPLQKTEKIIISTSFLRVSLVLPGGAAEDGVLVLALPLMTETIVFW